MFQLTMSNWFASYLLNNHHLLVQFIRDLFDATLVILSIFKVKYGIIVKNQISGNSLFYITLFYTPKLENFES